MKAYAFYYRCYPSHHIIVSLGAFWRGFLDISYVQKLGPKPICCAPKTTYCDDNCPITAGESVIIINKAT